jgi:hypothetical protein
VILRTTSEVNKALVCALIVLAAGSIAWTYLEASSASISAKSSS